MGAVEHVGLEELQIADIGVAALKLAHLLDFFKFALDEGGIGIALAVNQGQYRMAILPAVLASEPSRRLGKNQQTEEEQDGRNHLETPWDPEGSGAIDKAAAVGYTRGLLVQTKFH
jgi:hypothetical protein